MTERLQKEIEVLRCSEKRMSPYVSRLIELLDEYESRPLPDVLPLAPAWREFEWPASGFVDYRYTPHQINWSN